MDDKTRPDETGYRFIGKPLPRKEDARLITGKGRFTDDFSLDGQAYAVMVRSPYPHARIVAIDADGGEKNAGRARRVHRRRLLGRQARRRSRTIRCRRPNST